MGPIRAFEGRNRAWLLVLGLLVAIGPLLLAVRPALAAATFTVNRAADAPDRNLNDGVCDSDPQPGAQCTLRAAIQQANDSPVADTIEFDIPGFGVHTIRPTSELPSILWPVTIDGYSQPGAQPNTAATGTNAQLRIELNGGGAGDSPAGLHIQPADDTVVRGLVINRFTIGVAIGARLGPDTTPAPPKSRVRGARILGNFIGTNPAGTAALPNGIGVSADRCIATIVGGTAPADRNLISGNVGNGVQFKSSVAASNAVEGNLIGTQRDGRSVLGNAGFGVLIVLSANLTVGGAPAGAANTIAYNGADGV